MKIIYLTSFTIMLTSIFTSCSDKGDAPVASQELNMHWEMAESGSDEWLPATVPGSVHTDLRN